MYHERGLLANDLIVTDLPSTPAATDAGEPRTPPTDESPGADARREPVASEVPPAAMPSSGATPSTPPPSSSPADSPGSAGAAPVLGFVEGAPQTLDPRVIQVDLIANWILTGVLVVGVLPSALLAPPRGWRLLSGALAASLIGLLSWWGRRWAHLTFAHTSYTVRPTGCEIRRGVVWRRIINVPRSRIQHTDVTQGPLQRLYGLATLVLYTAGTEHAQIGLSGVSFDTAMAIRQYLLERTDVTAPQEAGRPAAVADDARVEP